MIHRIGNDLCKVFERIEDIWARFGERCLERRVFTDTGNCGCTGPHRTGRNLCQAWFAGRKLRKALGTGVRRRGVHLTILAL